MLVEKINFRFTQKLLLAWPKLAGLIQYYDKHLYLFKQQLGSVWSSSADSSSKLNDLHQIVELNRYNNGIVLMGKLIYYLNDRYAFQERWLNAINQLSEKNFKIRLIWTGERE